MDQLETVLPSLLQGIAVQVVRQQFAQRNTNLWFVFQRLVLENTLIYDVQFFFFFFFSSHWHKPKSGQKGDCVLNQMQQIRMFMFLSVKVMFALEVWTMASKGGILFRNNLRTYLLPKILLLIL